jgi:hypothetical protein
MRNRTAWLPPGKTAAVCFTIDDVHPGRSTDAYEAGGDLEKGALGHVAWLLQRHTQLQVTLFTTPDWREISPVPTRRLLKRLPLASEFLMLARTLPEGTMRLDRHPGFVSYLKSLPRTEVGLHGLHHIHAGERIYQEFQSETVEECEAKLSKAVRIFKDAGLPAPLGMTPPGWNAPPALLAAMRHVGLQYVASARDIKSEIRPDAVTAMSGLAGVSLLYPERSPSGLWHFTTNFQATSPWERAKAILDAGGLLAIKAHIIKNAMGFVALDGMDANYANFLDLLFARLESEYGKRLWWPSMGELAQHLAAAPLEKAG